MSIDVDTAVIGAGVVGLACARALAENGREVVILEAENAIGTITSARNSEVIHAGIYYPPRSLKARLCVAGKAALYAYCASHGIAHRRPGKIIVATSAAQQIALADLARQAAANGVDDLTWLGPADLAALEPALAGQAGLLSPSTGIVDSHGLMLALLGDAEAAGAVLALNAPLIDATARPEGGFELAVGGAEPTRLRVRQLVLAAGLNAQPLARRLVGLPADTVPACYYARGVYFTLQGRAPFSHLIYPAPEAAGLGIHLTLDLGGQARFGPDVTWVTQPDYTVPPDRAAAFEAAIRRYWPGLPDGALQPGYAGIRPKIQAPGQPAQDFAIHGPSTHGLAGLVCLYGIESPGLTAALAIGEHVRDMLV